MRKSAHLEFAVVDVVPADLAEPAMRLYVRRAVLQISKQTLLLVHTQPTSDP